MRVLHVTQATGGGVPQAIVDHIRNSPEQMHSILWPAANDALLGTSDVATIALPEGTLRQWRATRKTVRMLKPDAVIAHSTWAGLYTRFPSNLRMHVLYQPHAYVMEDDARPAFLRAGYHAVEKILAPHTTATLTLTRHEAATAIALGSPRVRIVPNTSHAHRSRSAASNISPAISTCGRICPQKDPRLFAAVATIVTRDMPEVKFIWIGDGDQAERRLLEDAGVMVTGWLPQEQTWSIIQTSEIYLHTARYEGFPLAVLDAAALGVAIVVRSIPAFERAGFLEGATARELAAQVVRILDDPQAMRSAEMASERFAEQHTDRAQQLALDEIYSVLSII